MMKLSPLLSLLVVGQLGWAGTQDVRPAFVVQNAKQLKALEQKRDSAKKNSNERAWLEWQLALNAPLVGENDKALEALANLAKTKQNPVSAEQMALTRGRILFQTGKFKEALKAYEEISKSSEFWFEAQEEEVWCFIRLNQADRATAKLATLFSPVFQEWVGPEAFFAANYNALKICDYETIFKNGELLKERQKNRLSEIEKLAKTGTNSQSEAVLARLEAGESAIKSPALLPRFFWRDEYLAQAAHEIQELKRSHPSAVELTAARKKLRERLQALAKADLSDYETVLRKLHIIEAEVIQRLYLDPNLKGKRPELAKEQDSVDTLTFPASDELWLDEIDQNRARVKACPSLKEAKL